MEKSKFTNLILLSAFAFFSQTATYAKGEPDLNLEDTKAYLKKKEAAVGSAYGANAFALSLSDEDKEIGRTIDKMTRQNKSPEQISKAVEKIKEKYRNKVTKEAEKRSKQGQARAEIEYRAQLNDAIHQNNSIADLHGFIRHALLKDLSKQPRQFESLDTIEEAVERTYTHIAPDYELLMKSNERLKQIISEYQQGHYQDLFSEESKALRQRESLLSDIANKEYHISAKSAFRILYRNKHNESSLDRISILQESASLTQAIAKAKNKCFETCQRNYKSAYKNLGQEVKKEIANFQETPLRRSLVRRHYKLLPSTGYSLDELSNFSTRVDEHVKVSGDFYNRVDQEIADIRGLVPESSTGEMNWNSSAIEDKALVTKIGQLIDSLAAAKKSKNDASVPPRSEHLQKYHGNYKETQAEAIALLDSYSRSKRNQTLAQIAKGSGKGLLVSGKYIGIGIGGVVASPFLLVGGVVYAVGKYVALPAASVLAQGASELAYGVSELAQGTVEGLQDYSRGIAQRAKIKKHHKAEIQSAIAELRPQVEDQLKSPDTSPLRKYVLKNLFKEMISANASVREIQSFDTLTNQIENDIGNLYFNLESLLPEELRNSKDTHDKIDWERVSFENATDSETSKLLETLETARNYRKSITLEWLSASPGGNYHGDYKRTEELCRRFIAQANKRKPNHKGIGSSTLQLVKSAGSFFSAPFLGAKQYFQKFQTSHLELANLQRDVDSRLKNPATTPLTKSILKHLFERVNNLTSSLEDLAIFDQKVEWYENKSASKYVDLENRIEEVTLGLVSKKNIDDWNQVDFSKINPLSISEIQTLLKDARAYRKVKNADFSIFDRDPVTDYHGDYKKTETLVQHLLENYGNYKTKKSFLEFRNSATEGAKAAGKVLVLPYYGAKYLAQQTQVSMHRYNIHQELKREKRALEARLGTKKNKSKTQQSTFRILKNKKKWLHLDSDDLNQVSEEAYDKYMAKLIQDDLACAKNLETIQKEAVYFSDLFVRKTAELRMQLRELMTHHATLKHDKAASRLDKSLNFSHEALVRTQIEFVFQNPESYNFSPLELEKLAAQALELNQLGIAKKLAHERIKEAKAELSILNASHGMSEKDRIYRKELLLGIKKTKRLLKGDYHFTDQHFQIIEDAKIAAETKFQNLEADRRTSEATQKRTFLERDLQKCELANSKNRSIDAKIVKLFNQKPEGFEAQLEEFNQHYCVNDGKSKVPYYILKQATEDLNDGKWNKDKQYVLTQDQLKLNNQIEAQAAYCHFIESQRLKSDGSNEYQNHDLKKDSETQIDESVGVTNEKSKETFIKNYVCLPEAPDLDTFDKMDQCLICFEPVHYEFQALSDYCDVAPEHDQLLQVPGDSEGHRLTTCGHLIHKACLEGLQINRGLAIYKCPKCPQQVPYDELDAHKRIEKHGFCLDYR